MLLLVVTSCTDFLNQKAVDSFNQDAVFSDVGMAKAFLGICYDRIGGDGSQVLGMREDMLACNTDEALCIHRPSEFTFVEGTLSPDNMGNFGSWRFSNLRWVNLYPNIQNVNTLLTNIDKVPAKTASDIALITQMKGEAYFIRAYDYAQIMMGTGGAILSSSPFLLGQDYLTITRSSLQETKDFILADIAKSIELLGTTSMEQGRATPGACAALKSRVLLFCASKLVNGGYEASNPLVSFTTGAQTTRLTEARDAAKAIMDGTYGSYDLVGTYTEPVLPLSPANIATYADNYFSIFNQKGAWNKETIWGIQYLVTGGNSQQRNLWSGPNGYHNWGNNDPLEPFVREYEMADGTPFVWGAVDTRSATAAELAANSLKNPYNSREPRFYATILYDGAKWQARPTDMAGADPLGIVQTGHLYKADGVTIDVPGLDTRQATVENWNGGKNGYYMKKFMDPTSQGQLFNNINTWVEFRFAEVLLNYAEACIELGDPANLQNGINALNKVRNRAGLPGRVTTDQVTARTWLRHERALELYGEDRRWYDIRRWMIAPTVITSVRQMLIKKFQDGSRSWQLDMTTTIDDRVFKPAAYWIPIPRDEMNKAPQLIQNPGY